MPEEIGGALYDEQPEPETLGACCTRPVKSPEDLPQFIGCNADAAVSYLEVHLRATLAAADEHATTARRVVNRIAHKVSQNPAKQNGVTKDGNAGRDDAKLDPLQSCRFGEFRGEILENGTQPYRDMEVIARSLTQLQSLDELAQHTGQLCGGNRGPHQLFPLLVTVKDSREDVVRTGDYLQWLAQVVASHRQQCRAEVVVESSETILGRETHPGQGTAVPR
jgi:hypothetical protein